MISAEQLHAILAKLYGGYAREIPGTEPVEVAPGILQRPKFPYSFPYDEGHPGALAEALNKFFAVDKPKHAVGVSVLVVHDGKLLLGKRLGDTATGLLSTPGGRLELEESVIYCAVREFHEETGARILPAQCEIIDARKHNRFGDQYVMFYVYTPYHEGTIGNPEPDKCAGWNFTSMLDFRPEECTEPTDVLAKVAQRIADAGYPCDCYSRPHHFQCNSIRKVAKSA